MKKLGFTVAAATIAATTVAIDSGRVPQTTMKMQL